MTMTVTLSLYEKLPLPRFTIAVAGDTEWSTALV